MRTPKRRTLTAIVIGGLALGAVPAAMAAPSTPSTPSAAARPNAEPTAAADGKGIVWGECPDPALSKAGLQCGTLEVPVDYRRPDGRAMRIAVSRLRSSDPERRRGVLLLNPGGPGLAGLDMPAKLVERGVPASVLKSYDLIGFDPRGIGHSTPVTCGLSPQQITSVFSRYPQGPKDVADQAVTADEIARQCVAKAGANLPYLTTRNTARDLDRIREALAEKKISYFGTSYGTYLGTVYNQMFPKRADRFVLDSAVDPGRVWRQTFRGWGQGAELRFPTSEPGRPGDTTRTAWARLLARFAGRTSGWPRSSTAPRSPASTGPASVS